MQVDGINIYIENNSLVLKKTRCVLIRNLLPVIFFMGMIIAIVATTRSRPDLKKLADPVTFSLVFILLSITALYFFNQLRIAILNGRSNSISIDKGRTVLNGRSIGINETDAVIIQKERGWEGLGASFIVGLAAGKKFYPLTFYHSFENAEMIARTIAEFLKKEVVVKKSKLFPWLKGY